MKKLTPNKCQCSLSFVFIQNDYLVFGDMKQCETCKHGLLQDLIEQGIAVKKRWNSERKLLE
jgi:hypothetical protein